MVRPTNNAFLLVPKAYFGDRRHAVKHVFRDSPQETAMNYISGRVVLKETGVGIPDLLVVIHDVDPRTNPEEGIGTPGAATGVAPAAAALPSIGDRLGSRLTAANGGFEFS